MFTTLNLITYGDPKVQNSKMRRKSCISFAKKVKSPEMPAVSNGDKTKLCKRIQRYSDSQAIIKSGPPKETIEHDINDNHNKEIKKLMKQVAEMTTEELNNVLVSEDDSVVDCILDRTKTIKGLRKELDELSKQVSILANYNYAREPEFVRDRMKVRDTVDDAAPLCRHITSKHLEPFIDRLSKTQDTLTREARKREELSESKALEFLSRKTSYEDFIDDYIDLRKETSIKRILADKLAKERDQLADNLIRAMDSPIPTPRQRKKRVSFTPKQ